jgi:hypothetical protein
VRHPAVPERRSLTSRHPGLLLVQNDLMLSDCRLCLAALAIAVVLGGCGEGQSVNDRSIGGVRDCLEGAGLQTTTHEHGPRGSANAPAATLDAAGASISFFGSGLKARSSEHELRETAKRLEGSATRHQAITVLYVDGPPEDRVERCVV